MRFLFRRNDINGKNYCKNVLVLTLKTDPKH